MKKMFLSLLCSGAILLTAAPGFSFMGINYSPFHYSGQSPLNRTPVSEEQIIADLQTISGKFQVIRTYGVDSATALIRVAPLAEKYTPNLKVWLGVYEDGNYNGKANKIFLDTAIEQANAHANICAVVVGNECLPGDPVFNPVSVEQLIEDLKYIRSKIKKGILVTTCLTYGAAGDNRGSRVAAHCDVMMINIYTFYGGVAIGNNQAINNLRDAYVRFVNRYPGKPIVIGETGWPSAPADKAIKEAVPGLANEEVYYRQIIGNASHLGDTFLYEAFDEPWGPGGNVWGPHWGLWDQNRKPKIKW
jgi:exo-beta-1,3-glucanase (GH17 family)